MDIMVDQAVGAATRANEIEKRDRTVRGQRGIDLVIALFRGRSILHQVPGSVRAEVQCLMNTRIRRREGIAGRVTGVIAGRDAIVIPQDPVPGTGELCVDGKGSY